MTESPAAAAAATVAGSPTAPTDGRVSSAAPSATMAAVGSSAIRKPDVPLLERLVDHLLDGGVDGLDVQLNSATGTLRAWSTMTALIRS